MRSKAMRNLMLATTILALTVLSASAQPLPQQGGEAIYKGICQDCHMPDGRGGIGAGAYPALVKNPKLAEPGYPVGVVVHGQKAMPPFGGSLNDQQIADVVNYIRGHFGNSYKDQVSPADVKAQR
jgi:mono/diheme cytochrome c family protein